MSYHLSNVKSPEFSQIFKIINKKIQIIKNCQKNSKNSNIVKMFKQIQIIKIYQKFGQAMCPHHSNHSSKSTVSKWEGAISKENIFICWKWLENIIHFGGNLLH